MAAPTDDLITKSDRRHIASPIGWPAIFAATVVALALSLLLHLFGIGFGLIAIELDKAGTLRSVGVGAGIWSVIVPILALFVGGLVVGRVAPTTNKLSAAIHGAVVWGLAVLFSFAVVAAVVQGVAKMGVLTRAETSASSAPIEMSQFQQIPSVLALDARELVGPINRRLQAQGMPRVTAAQIDAIVDEAVETALFEGGIDRAKLIDIATRRTQLSRAEVEKVADQIEAEMAAASQRKQEPAGLGGTAAMQQVAESAGKVILTVSFMMLLALGATLAGAILGVPREHE